jgi:hypothetical protein
MYDTQHGLCRRSRYTCPCECEVLFPDELQLRWDVYESCNSMGNTSYDNEGGMWDMSQAYK